jgi:hypothetical protein
MIIAGRMVTINMREYLRFRGERFFWAIMDTCHNEDQVETRGKNILKKTTR